MSVSSLSKSDVQPKMADRLIRKRLESGQTKEQISNKLEVSIATYELYEAGLDRISPENILKLCDRFTVMPSYFFAD
jgi:transcriptional regulator with XRE-family HTH domain